MAAACISPPEVEYGFVSYASLTGGATWPTNTDVIYKCFKYYGLAESDRLTCQAGSWTGTMPICEWNSNTEIIFWMGIALVVLMLLLLLAVIIFMCCYFSRCCKGSQK